MLRIANMSGFWGDRLSAAEEVLAGGPDVVTGDYLAELTLAILSRRTPGFVPSFLEQMKRVLGDAVRRGVKIVSNAGGLAPRALAEELGRLAASVGVDAKIAWVDGDDLGPDPARRVVMRHAYLGGWGIREALARGADVVVTGRVADASLVIGPAAWRFGWARDAWDELAGAALAGHLLECSAQVTGGNHAFFEESDFAKPLGFPFAEMEADGSFVVTKAAGTGGRVDPSTVTAQLLYEIQGERYINPDVVLRLGAVQLESAGPDRVRVSGARGEPPPPALKVSAYESAGFKNTVDVMLAGLDVEKKAAIVTAQIERALAADPPASLETRLSRTDREDPATNEQALATLRITARDPDMKKVGRRFSSAVVELALASVPGFTLTSPPEDARPVIVLVPDETIDRTKVPERVHLGADTFDVPPPKTAPVSRDPAPAPGAEAEIRDPVRIPLGALFGARSGDKGGDATLGLWARDDAAARFLDAWATTSRLQALIPEATNVTRTSLPNLRAVLFVLHGLLGTGAASSSRVDPQAKTLGEYVRAKWIDVPAELVR